LSGITESVAYIIDSAYSLGPEENWYFMFISTFLNAFMGAFVTEKVVASRLGLYHPSITPVELGKLEMNPPLPNSARY
jgi:aminobenzoyl-glutamate transport protein